MFFEKEKTHLRSKIYIDPSVHSQYKITITDHLFYIKIVNFVPFVTSMWDIN